MSFHSDLVGLCLSLLLSVFDHHDAEVSTDLWTLQMLTDR